MAKDPAFLFYPNDWLGGTMVFTRHQKGCYMDLLIAQFNFGPLSLETIKTVLGQDQAVWTILSGKFKKNSDGNFYNKRLAAEIEKRRKFSESRRQNVSKRYQNPTHEATYAHTTDVHMENRNRNENCIKEKGGMGGKTISLSPDGFFLNELDKSLTLTKDEIDNTVQYIYILVKKTINHDEVKRYWQAYKIQWFEKKEWKNTHADMISHFRDFLRIKITVTNGKQTATSVGKEIEFDRP